MTRLIRYWALVVLVAAAAYGLTCYYASRRQAEDQWTWLRNEFHLTGAQLARIRALHEAYEPVCAGHCRRVAATNGQLAELRHAGREDSPEYLKTLDQWEAIKHECNEATFKYLQTVAAVMSPADGRRYLAMMVPRIVQPDRIGPLGIR